ncbi:MAG TPA: BTAD domain-containing putative transcriptional regulator [Candidatus Limnocylindrales bacterium]|nr:BTAD domain-containing putative transcriptional regulator [Candidatus Limnocylindrales bacterium]
MVDRRPGWGPVRALRVSVRLLGRVELEINGRRLRLAGRQAQALVALLVLVRRVRARDAIATDLWPDALGATGSLRQALWLLRSSLTAAGLDPDQLLESDADALGLRPDVDLDVDVDRFDDAVGGPAPDPGLAIELYQGELVECLGHECFARERERLADAYEDALVLVAERRLAEHDMPGAREAALRLLARDPLREEAHRVLLRVYGSDGTRAQVLRQFRRLSDLLRRELDVEPLPETVAAFQHAMHHAEARSAEAVVHLRLAETAFVAVGPGRATEPASVAAG